MVAQRIAHQARRDVHDLDHPVVRHPGGAYDAQGADHLAVHLVGGAHHGELLEQSERADGVKIFIGGESTLVPLDECSIVTAPYEVDGQVVGTVGVIGPTRMAYERVIPIVDVTAKLLSSALSQH